MNGKSTAEAVNRDVTPQLRPYLFGGAASGALIAGAVAAFLSITALVSENTLPDGARMLQPPRPATLTVGRAENPASTAQAAVVPAAVVGVPAGPLALSLPTSAVTAPPTVSPQAIAATLRRAFAPSLRTGRGASGKPSHHRPAGHSGNEPGSGAGIASQSSPTATSAGTQAKVASASTDTTGGEAPTTLGADSSGGAAPAAPPPAPPGLAKSGGTPPGLAKKPGGLPPGLAKKPGGLPPGQAKK